MEETKKKSSSNKKENDIKIVKKSTSKKSNSTKKSTKESTIKKDRVTKKVEKKPKIEEKNIDKTKEIPTENLDNSKKEEKITIDINEFKKNNTLSSAITLIISFLLFNIRWIEYRYEFFGYKSSQNITILQNDMFDLSFLLGIAKIFGVICVILFFIILIDSFINLESQFNSLKKYDLKTNLPLIYYGSYIICLTFTLLGILFTKYAHVTIGYIITLIIIIICINITFNKKVEENKKDE